MIDDTASARLVERVRHTPYGQARHSWKDDVDGDGDSDSSDSSAMTASFNKSIGEAGYNVDADVNRSGKVTLQDTLPYSAKSALAAGSVSDYGAGKPDSAVGYDGCVFNVEGMNYTVRHRSYMPLHGRWGERDPATNGMLDESGWSIKTTLSTYSIELIDMYYISAIMNNQYGRAYTYSKSMPLTYIDPTGLCECQDLRDRGKQRAPPDGCTGVPDTYGGFADFTHCCNNHDNCYVSCGPTKASCDLSFLGCMDTECIASAPSPSSPQSCYERAATYFNGVRILGGYLHWKAQRKYCICCDHYNLPGIPSCQVPAACR